MSLLSSVATADLMFDLSSRTKLRLTGADRVRFLNGQVSNDMRRASTQESVYTCVMTIKGKMCADAFVHAGEDFLFVDSEPGLREALAARLERYIIADDVALEDVTDDFHLLHLLPATAGANADALVLPDIAELPGDPVLAGKVQVIQSSRFGRAGIDLFIPSDLAEDYCTALNGQFQLLIDEQAEALRIAAGVPRWGVELGEDTMPAEAGLEARAVSYNKGCYIGQEVVSRVKSVGHVNWQLRGLRSTAGEMLEPGMILRENADPAGREIGQITSVSSLDVFLDQATAPARQIALGFIRRGWETSGTVLNVHAKPVSTENPAPDAAPATLIGQVEVQALPFLNL